jgi:hypothetical protein
MPLYPLRSPSSGFSHGQLFAPARSFSCDQDGKDFRGVGLNPKSLIALGLVKGSVVHGIGLGMYSSMA